MRRTSYCSCFCETNSVVLPQFEWAKTPQWTRTGEKTYFPEPYLGVQVLQFPVSKLAGIFNRKVLWPCTALAAMCRDFFMPGIGRSGSDDFCHPPPQFWAEDQWHFSGPSNGTPYKPCRGMGIPSLKTCGTEPGNRLVQCADGL